MNERILARNFSPFIGGRLPQKVRSAARLPEQTGGADGGIRRFYRQICGKLRPIDRECSLPPFDGKQQIMVPSIRLMSMILETGQQAETARARMEMKYGYMKGNLAME